MTAGEDLYLVVLSELRDLDREVRADLGRMLVEQTPWHGVPPQLQALFEDWAELLAPAEEPA